LAYINADGMMISESPNKSHYEQPNLIQILRNIAVFGLRSLESGRLVLWIAGLATIFFILKRKFKIEASQKVILLVLILHLGLYLIFIFITKMYFCERYFFPHFLALTIIAALGIWHYLSQRKAVLIFFVILAFEISGNLWIYPAPISNSWDCTLAHLPFYKLRKECFEYIDSSKISYNKIAADYSLYGSREVIELRKNGKTIKNQTECKSSEYDYFIYSNISNSNDSLVQILQNTHFWEPIKTFNDGFVEIIIYKKKTVSY
jgi:hypothetical protein